MLLPPPREWPFLHPLVPAITDDVSEFRIAKIHEAFENHQVANTRLVTTNASYLMQVWLHAIGQRHLRIVATADRESLAEHAPEALARRGPFASPSLELILLDARDRTPAGPGTPGSSPSFARLESSRASVAGPTLPAPPALPAPPDTADQPALSTLVRAFRTRDPQERLALCIEALDRSRTAPALLAAASTCMEVNDLEAAARDLDEAVARAPDWAAAHFEHGKLWLRRDDMEQASAAFRRATALLPTFTAAWANLGATLGELDRSEEALAALEAALALDPENPQALNNVGVARRELGRLDDSAAAFRRVTELAPERAFGYYNLGHTLFLGGRYEAALSAYIEGQRRDGERNPVQATRLAICRLATGDAVAALAELRQATAALPRERKRQLLADAQTVAWALLTHRPDLPGWGDVNGWIGAELARLS